MGLKSRATLLGLRRRVVGRRLPDVCTSITHEIERAGNGVS